MKESIESIGDSKERAVTALAEAFGAAFSSTIQEASQSKTSTSCTRIEKTSLAEVLRGVEAPLSAVVVKFLEGLNGSGLVLIRKEDLAAFARKLLRVTEATEIDDQKIWEAWEPVFNKAMEKMGAEVAPDETITVKTDVPVLVSQDANPDSLSDFMTSFKNVVYMTFELSVESGPESNFWLLAPPDILTSLEALLCRDAAALEGDQNGKAPSKWNIDLILDVELGVTVAFGDTEMPLKDVLKLGVGSIIELGKKVNDPVTIVVNRKPIARGEVVMVDGNYGVRILEVESTADRIRSLG